MAEKTPSWKSLVQQIVTLNFCRSNHNNNPDPFWLMISRRLSKRKMETNEKDVPEAEPGSSKPPSGDSSQIIPGPSRPRKARSTVLQPHSFKVLVGDRGDRLEQMKEVQIDCPMGDTWTDPLDNAQKATDPTRFASGDDNAEQVISKLQTSAGYQFQQLLQEGQFSKVYLVRSNNPAERLACKLTTKRRRILPPPEESDEDGEEPSSSKKSKTKVIQAPMSEEAQLHNRFKHKNIVQLVGYLVEGDVLGIVMEWCPLGNLSNLLSSSLSGLLPESVARRYFRQMVDAVEFVHMSGYVHKEIACHHFLIDSKDVIKLCDFGLADKIYDQTLTKRSETENPWYQPPEYVLDGECNVKQYDLWALGCCLHKMTTARLPFMYVDDTALRWEYSTFAVRMSQPLKDLLEGFLAILPETRFSMTRIKNSEWLNLHDSRVFIGNAYRARPCRDTTSIQEAKWRAALEI